MSKNYKVLCIGETTVLFSYVTPVIVHTSGSAPKITEKKHSATTTKHINKFLRENDFSKDRCNFVSQEEINFLTDKELVKELYA